ncbi:MAG: glycosyltransferase family 9 protein [bacterium]
MEKILIIQLCRLGDVVQTLPLVMRLKEVKKGSHISFVCRKEYSGIVPCSYGVDRLIYPSHEFLGQIEKQPKDALRIIPELEEEYDYVINLTANPIAGRIC